MTLWIVTVAVMAAVGPALVIPLVRRRTTRARWRAVRGSARPGRDRRTPAEIGRGIVLDAPVLVPTGLVALGGVGGFVLGGPMLAALLAVYLCFGSLVLRRRLVRRGQEAARAEVVDAVAGVAADLRAGLGISRALAAIEPVISRAVVIGAEAGSVAGRIKCAVTVAEASGAPLADVLERLDHHLRAVDRARAVAAAQAAGAHASAGLLAVLPVAGVGLGGVIGVDPWHVLLQTPLGAIALSLAVVLQLVGLAWSARLARIEVPA